MIRDFQIDNVTPSPLLSAFNAVTLRMNTGVARFLEAAGYHPEPLVYGGYASESRARIIGRVVMSVAFDQRMWLRDRRGWRQFFDAQAPFDPVVVRFGQATVVTYTDDDGYFDVEFADHGLPPGTHDVSVQVLHRRDVREAGGIDSRGHINGKVRATSRVSTKVRVVGSQERQGIVSDIDDTIVVSMIPRPMVAARHAFFDRVAARQAVPGMSEFLRFMSSGMHCHAETEHHMPQVYLSTGAWNMVPGLRDFVARGRFPFGAFLMTNFGPDNTGWFRSGREHKRRELRRLAEFFPHIQWFLVGDDGQRDPQIYTEFAQDHPRQVAGIAIRTLSPVEMFLTHGTPLQIMPDALRDVPAHIPVWLGEDGYALLDQVRGYTPTS